MDVLLELLKTYWKEIVSVVLFIASVIIFIIRKKPFNIVNSLFFNLFLMVMKAICVTEDNYKHGCLLKEDKKDYCLSLVEKQFSTSYPELDFKDFLSTASQFVEAILSTPEKKG